jgi:hypothetical protein
MLRGQITRGLFSRLASRSLLAISAAFAASTAFDESHAQSPSQHAAVQQARMFMERPDAVGPRTERLAPPVDSVSGEESAADEDIGEQWLLKPNIPVNPFTARASLSLFYTDNVALARRSRLEDGFAVAEIGLGYTRPLATDWTLGIDLQQALFRYHEHKEFDFESLNASVAISYQARQLGNAIFSLHYGLNRLTGGAADDQLYLGNTIALVALKVVPVTSAGAVELTGGVGYTFADPEELERTEFRLGVAYRLRVARKFVATAALRLELYDYSEEVRTDLLQTIALGARYDVNEWFFLSASVSAANNFSTQRVFRYTAINAGVTLAAHIEF